jgi:hypothetical protein
VIQFSHLVLREENLAHGSRDGYFRITIELGRSKSNPEKVTKSREPFDRGQAMPGTSEPGIATYLIDRLVKADARRDVTMRSRRRIEFFWYPRSE